MEHTPSTGVPMPGFPAPLHIVKKRRHSRDLSSSLRRTSPSGDVILGRISESPDLDTPVTVIKKRASTVFQGRSSEEVNSRFYSRQSASVAPDTGK